MIIISAVATLLIASAFYENPTLTTSIPQDDITETRKGVFSYGYYPEGEKIKPVSTVTIKNLVNRECPLKILPRYPTHGLTRRKNTRIFPGDGVVACFHEEDKYEVISKAGTKVLILEECPEGEYEVYYKGKMAKMRKGNLKPVK